ncbi:hypothetical protein [Mycobacterium noviomagense]|uniref:Secreted protein n=1 Tax=Mycobacterium noviomagense TaxID=459858 RepID=A0A7I7P822_9MYCO|nr:hypothetical protein [Mycobacterium noviomagense]ORB18769.1 hypothetical protein BST37_01015 [Mycobacterium noviomagense]BBY04819.1 hypothetical protein MNVI_01370 [Mycobacterium noviomagense]
MHGVGIRARRVCTWRVVAPVVVLAVVPQLVPASVAAEPPATQVITAVPVGPNGEPVNGYQEAPSPSNVTDVADCTTPSPAAVADDIYYCSPSAADADVCWPSTPGSLLCVDNPWGQQLHRVNYPDPLPQVQPLAAPQPFALLLDDGTRCRLRNGGAWGGRADGYVGAYGCGAVNSNLAVLVLPSQGATFAIDRSMPVWTVKVGQIGTPNSQFPPPQTHTVSTAWFAGNFVPV